MTITLQGTPEDDWTPEWRAKVAAAADVVLTAQAGLPGLIERRLGVLDIDALRLLDDLARCGVVAPTLNASWDVLHRAELAAAVRDAIAAGTLPTPQEATSPKDPPARGWI